MAKFRRFDGRRRGRRFARHHRQPADAVVEHLVQVLVDLPVDLGNLFAQLLAATAEILGVEILLDVLFHLPANGLLGDDLGSHRLGGRRRWGGGRLRARGIAATGGGATHELFDLIRHVSRDGTRSAGRRLNLLQFRHELSDPREKEEHHQHHQLQQGDIDGGQ